MGKGGVPCGVCGSKVRAQIELGLVHRVPLRVLAERFGLSRDAIARHGRNHLSPAQRAAILAHVKPREIDLEQLRVSESEGLLSQLVTQRARLQSTSELAAEMGDVRGAVQAESAITKNLALVGQLLGQLVTRHEVRSTSLLVSPDYLRLRQVLMTALEPFPEARQAVGRALLALEKDAADEITAASRKPQPVVASKILPPPPC